MDGEHPEIPAGRQAHCGGGQGGSADFGRPFTLHRSARPFNMGVSFLTSTHHRTSLVLVVSSVRSIHVGSQNNIPMAPINFPLARQWNCSTRTFGGRMAWNLSIKVLPMKNVALFTARGSNVWTIYRTTGRGISLPGIELKQNLTSCIWSLEIGSNLRAKLWNNGDTT